MFMVANLVVVIFSVMAVADDNALISNLKRQLTGGNSDYSLEDVNETETLQMRANSKLVESQKNDEVLVLVTKRHSKNQSKAKHDKKQRIGYKEISRQNFYITNLRNIQKIKISTVSIKKDQSTIKEEHAVSNKDLLDYIDDQKLVPESKKINHDENHHSKMSNTSRSTVKYRFLKLKHQHRRHNRPRLIQEEDAEKVVIVNLDEGPIPELRLPPSRRQYMRDPGEVIADEEEVPPPPINSSDPEAAPDDESTD